MSNALDSDSAPRSSPAYTQASPDIGGMPGGVVPVSPGAQGNALGVPPAAPTAGLGNPGAVPQAQPQPAPTHEQVVVALRHTSEVSHQLMGLMKDPEIGRKDMRSQIVDASLELVQKGLATVPAIVEQIKDLPSDPKRQLEWVKGHLLANQLAQFAILEHYRAANPPTFDAAAEVASRGAFLHPKNKKKHGDVIQSVISHYKGPR